MGPELVLVIGELADFGQDREVLDMGLRGGAARGVRIIASSTRPEALPHDLISAFTTRLLLHVDEEAQSIQLLGRPDAADLGADGDLLLRVGGRSPALLRGFRVPPERLDQLIDVNLR